MVSRSLTCLIGSWLGDKLSRKRSAFNSKSPARADESESMCRRSAQCHYGQRLLYWHEHLGQQHAHYSVLQLLYAWVRKLLSIQPPRCFLRIYPSTTPTFLVHAILSHKHEPRHYRHRTAGHVQDSGPNDIRHCAMPHVHRMESRMLQEHRSEGANRGGASYAEGYPDPYRPYTRHLSPYR